MFVYFSDQNPEVLALPCPQPQGTSFPGLRSYLPVAVCAYLILLLVSVPYPVGSNQKAEIHSRTHLWERLCPALFVVVVVSGQSVTPNTGERNRGLQGDRACKGV